MGPVYALPRYSSFAEVDQDRRMGAWSKLEMNVKPAQALIVGNEKVRAPLLPAQAS
jgi:hypothetical protein